MKMTIQQQWHEKETKFNQKNIVKDGKWKKSKSQRSLQMQ